MTRHTHGSHIAAKNVQLAKLERELRQVSDENADLWKAVESFERIIAGVRDAKAARLVEANPAAARAGVQDVHPMRWRLVAGAHPLPVPRSPMPDVRKGKSMNKKAMARGMRQLLPNHSMPDCENAIDAFAVVLTDAMRRGEPVAIQGFGTFLVVTRDGRIPFNKMAGELAGKPYRTKRILFKPGKYLKAAAKGGKDNRATVLGQLTK